MSYATISPAVMRGFKATASTVNDDLRALKTSVEYVRCVPVQLLHSHFFTFLNRCPENERNDLVRHAIATGLILDGDCEKVKSLKTELDADVFGELVRRTAKMYAPSNADWWFPYNLKEFRRDAITGVPVWETAVSPETFAAVAPLVGLMHLLINEVITVDQAKRVREFL